MQSEYLTTHIIEYPEGSGKEYIFDPYLFGRGAWAHLKINGERGRWVSSSLQKQLNEFFFKRNELPTLYERFMNSSQQEREQMKDISMGWLQLKIKALRQNIELPTTESIESKGSLSPGQMYFYFYDAKHKATLPMWDKFPLTVILERRSSGFLGLNVHYLPMDERSILIGNLLRSSSVYNKSTNRIKLLVDYYSLKRSKSKYKGFENCIKEYLFSHISGKVLPVESHEWLYAILLPTENFQYKK